MKLWKTRKYNLNTLNNHRPWNNSRNIITMTVMNILVKIQFWYNPSNLTRHCKLLYLATFATHKSRNNNSLCAPLLSETKNTKFASACCLHYYKILGYHDNQIYQKLWLCSLIIFDTKCALSIGRKLI